MKSLIALMAIVFMSSCAHQAQKAGSKGHLLKEARYEAMGTPVTALRCDSSASENPDRLVEQVSQCAHLKKWDTVEALSKVLAAKASDSGWGAYFLSLSSEHQGQTQKALWMADLAIKKEPGRAVFYYQKARIQGALGDEAGQEKTLELGYSQEPDIEPFLLLTAKKSYAVGDCAKLTKLSETRGLSKIGTGAVLTSECMALDGRVDEARVLLDQFLKSQPNNAEVLLQRARIEETFAANFVGASQIYQKISKSSQEADLLAWVRSKLEYLQGSQTLQSIKVSQKGDQ